MLLGESVTLLVDGGALVGGFTAMGTIVGGVLGVLGRAALATIREMIDALKENTRTLGIVCERTEKLEEIQRHVEACNVPAVRNPRPPAADKPSR